MIYFPFHHRDFFYKTSALSHIETSYYLRMLSAQYDSECALPENIQELYRMVGAKSRKEKQAADYVLGEFFILTEDGYINRRAAQEINQYHTNNKAAHEAQTREVAPSLPAPRSAGAARQSARRAEIAALRSQLAAAGVAIPKTDSVVALRAAVQQLGAESVTGSVTDSVTQSVTPVVTPVVTDNVTGSVTDNVTPVTSLVTQPVTPVTQPVTPVHYAREKLKTKNKEQKIKQPESDQRVRVAQNVTQNVTEAEAQSEAKTEAAAQTHEACAQTAALGEKREAQSEAPNLAAAQSCAAQSCAAQNVAAPSVAPALPVALAAAACEAAGIVEAEAEASPLGEVDPAAAATSALGACCFMLRHAGFKSANMHNPEFAALFAKCPDIGAWQNAANIAREKGKLNLNYLLAIIKNQLQNAADIQANIEKGDSVKKRVQDYRTELMARKRARLGTNYGSLAKENFVAHWGA